MKIIVALFMLSMLFTPTVHATLYLSWSAGAGFFFQADPGTGILGLGDSALAQLIWRPNNTPDFSAADAANVNNVNLLAPGEVLLASYEVTNNGGAFEDYAFFVSPPNYSGPAPDSGGYVYGRIFQNDNPQIGDYFYTGTIDVALTRDEFGSPPDTPQVYQLNRDTMNGDAIDGAFGFQVVPEPGTIAMLALGIMTLGGAAHKRRKAAIVEA